MRYKNKIKFNLSDSGKIDYISSHKRDRGLKNVPKPLIIIMASLLTVLIVLVLLIKTNTFGLYVPHVTSHVAMTNNARLQQKKKAKTIYAYATHITDTTGQRERIHSEVVRNGAQSFNLEKQGVIAIPDLGILLPIYNNAYMQSALKLGANTFLDGYKNNGTIPQAIMGKGNYCLASHNYADGTTEFSPLQQNVLSDKPYLTKNGNPQNNDWLSGMKVYMANDKGVYEYKIVTQVVVEKHDMSVLNTQKTPQLTIITCLFPSDAYRIITKAILIQSYSWEKAPLKDLGYVDTSNTKPNIEGDVY